MQRLRPAIGHPRGAGGTARHRACARCGRSSPTSPARSATIRATARTGAQVSQPPVRRPSRSTTGMTLEEIGGRGVRWVEREAFDVARLGAGRARRPERRARRGRGQAAARHLPPAVGGQGRRPLAGAAVHPRPPDRRALAGRRRRARHQRGRPGRGRQRHPRARAACKLRAAIPAGSVFLAEGIARGQRQRAARTASSRSTGSVRAPIEPSAVAGPGPARRRGPGRDAAVRAAADPAAGGHMSRRSPRSATTSRGGCRSLKAIAIFFVVFNLVPIALLADRKVLGRFQHRYGPNRVGPFGALQADRRHRQAASSRSSSARRARNGWLFALAPGDLDDDRGGDDRDHPVLGHRRHLRHADRASTASTRRSASSTRSRSAASRSTA